MKLEEWSPAGGALPRRALERYDALVVLGGDQNVCERDRFPYLDEEIDLIAGWLDRGRPLLGVCLGAQLLAYAAGGEVVRGDEPELGWYDVDADRRPATRTRCSASARSRCAPSSGTATSHSRRAARACSRTARPAFRPSAIGAAWGVQYHPEVTTRDRRGLDRGDARGRNG